jgi:hypothetical protein
MSDPVTNVEIEDVLSSIRKLVSEDSRPASSARKPERLGRLVLTPDQRVPDEASEPARSSEPVLLTQPVATPDKSDATEVSERSLDEIPGDARLADFGDVEGAFPDFDTFEADPQPEAVSETESALDDTAAEPEDPADPADHGNLNRMIEEEVAAALGVSDAHERHDTWDDAADESDAPELDEYGSGDEVYPTEDSPGEDTEAAAHEDPGTAKDFSWNTPSVSDGDAPVEADFESSEEEDDMAAPLPEDWARDTDAHETDADEPAPDAPPQTLEDKVAALGRLVARGNDEFEEERDRPDADELAAASEPMAWPDDAPFVEAEEPEEPVGSNVLDAHDAWPKAEPDQPAARAEPPVTRPEPAAPSAPEDDPFEIDEAILRELVGDIVRQELQGALGERITRNVRKLVRREIHRMLISQDFD